MVFLGKPSRSCAPCRRRKLRCDLSPEACGQCVRAGLTCSGYRDPNQLRIRDETHSVRQKALTGKSTLTLQNVDIPLDEKARAAFFSHYVSGMSRTYDVLERLGNQASIDRHLEASVNAVSLALFQFKHHSTGVFDLTREKYAQALPLVNKALASPQTRSQDSTLLAILLLDLCEKMMHNSPRSSDSWMSHVKGALALMEMRHEDQLKTYIGRRLSVRLFTNMLISCVAADAPLPPALMKLRTDLEPFVPPDDPKWKVSGLVCHYANFRGAVRDGLLSNSEVIQQAKKLDGDFNRLAQSLPQSWIHLRVPLQRRSSRVLEQYYDVYPDYFAAQTCNVIRNTRILLNDMIRSALEQIGSEDTGTDIDPRLYSIQAQIATEIIDALAKEICATGPQFAGVEALPTKLDGFAPLRRVHCYTLLFPFYVAGMYASPKTGIQSWVVQQMRSMSKDLGIRNADEVADMLERPEKPSIWAIYAMLGSYAFAA